MIGKIILGILVVAMVLFLAWMLISLILKNTADNRRGKPVWFLLNLIPRRVEVPSSKASQYYDRFPKKIIPDVYSYATTLDDVTIRELAEALEKKIGNRSDSYKARYILAFVQMAIRYQSDLKTYRSDERYAFPCCTLEQRVGDCEDMALLGASLSKLLGIDAIIIHMTGHLAYAVNVNGFGKKIEFDGKKYIWAEATGFFPLGFVVNDKEIDGCYYPKTPPTDYIATQTYEDSFSKYL